MKTEIKEVTVEQKIYIAEDGTEFTDEDACGDYELGLLEKTLKCYDEDYNKCDIRSATYVNLITCADVENFRKVSDCLGLDTDGIDKPGLYRYTYVNYYCEQWLNLDDIIFNIRGGLQDGSC